MKVPGCIGCYGDCQFHCDPVTDPGQISIFEHADDENRLRVECPEAIQGKCFRVAHIHWLRCIAEAIAASHDPGCNCALCMERKRRW